MKCQKNYITKQQGDMCKHFIFTNIILTKIGTALFNDCIVEWNIDISDNISKNLKIADDRNTKLQHLNGLFCKAT